MINRRVSGLAFLVSAVAAATAVLLAQAPPGTYTVTLALGDHEYTQKLAVKKDPHSSGSEADVAAFNAMLKEQGVSGGLIAGGVRAGANDNP